MARTPRIELAGGIHHVTARAPYGRVLFTDAVDRQAYLGLLAEEIARSRWEVLSHCQMTNHLHLLIRTLEANLGSGMKRLHERFANHVNRRHRQHGHVFGARFANRLVRDDRHLHACLRYIVRNPVEAGMCASAADWPWSAHRELIGLASPNGCVAITATMSFLGPNVGAGRIAYQELLAPDTDALLARWARSGSDAWMPAAADVFGLSVDALATALGVGRETARRRLKAARRAG